MGEKKKKLKGFHSPTLSLSIFFIMSNPDEWLEKVKRCEYLPEQDIKKLCEMVII
jgi:hypothetical protein